MPYERKADRIMKRFLAVLLCLLMCVSMLPVAAFAEEAEIDDENLIEEHKHDMAYVAAVEPSFKPGHIAYYYCADCGGMYADADGETELAVDVCRRAFEQGATVVVMPGYCDYVTIHHAGYNCVQFGGVTPESLYIPGDSGYGYILVSNGDFMHQTQSDNWYVNQ